MTDQAIVAWDPNSGASLPAYLTEGAADLGTNIVDRMNVPSLSYEGKTWTLVKDGNKTKLQAQNSDGDMVPVPVMRMVILNYNPERGRAYYPGVYNPAESKQPDCWSADGKAPDPNSLKRQSTACNGCPMSVKGSKVDTNGKEGVACSSHRMVAIAPPGMLNEDPFRLKIAVTSDWDKTVVEHGWFAFSQYTDFIKSRGITHTAMVVTKVKFDPNTAYPKLLFSIDRLLDPAEFAQAREALKNPKVAELLNEKWSAAGTAGKLADQSDTSPGGLEAAYADGWIAHPESGGYSYRGTEVVDNVTLAARYPVVAKEPEPTPQPAVPASQQVIDVPAVPVAPPVAAPAPVLGGVAAAVADGWIVHPTAPGYHYKGEEVVADTDLEARYPAAPPVVEAAAPPPPPPPAPAPAPVVSPADQAAADGWLQHPSSPPHMYRGEEVLTTEEVLAKYAGNGVAPTAAGAPSASPAAASQAAPTSPAPTGSAEVPPEVQGLLDKWT